MSLLEGQRFAVVDVETTGFDPGRGATVLEVARVTVEHSALSSEWSTLIGPPRPIPADATRIHGITEAMLVDAPDAREAAGILAESCEGAILVFHNAPFDVPFVNALLRQAGRRPLWNPVIDTLGLARGLFGTGSNSLGALGARLQLPREDAHRALGDARTTARALLQLVGLWERERGARSIAEVAAASQDEVRSTSRRNAAPRGEPTIVMPPPTRTDVALPIDERGAPELTAPHPTS